VAYLLITVEGKPPTRRALEGATIVGRALECAVWIDDSRLSRQHCRIEPLPDGDGWSVIDLNSKNGTIVKGERISAHKLADGDEIFVGRARLLFHSRSAPPQRPTTPTIASGPGTAKPASISTPSSADTLVDSRFPIPQINPHAASGTKSVRPRGTRPMLSAAQRPLAFQRPPARPRVDDSHLNVVTRMWRRLRRAVRRANG
jgi:pSer/pThr/pTyr-binding forkhead associated (FHA) protein